LSCVSLYYNACLSFFNSTAALPLYINSLTGTIPSQIGMLTKLSELSVSWLLVVMIVVMYFSLHSIAWLSFFILQFTWIFQKIV
jgi:hypothetical protein